MADRVASLFSGIGGFELGFQRVGLKTELMCEIDPAAQAVLGERFPNIPIETDVAKLSALRGCNILVGGWPCQDLSQAGRTAGIGGSQSGLVNHVFRLIDAATPKPDVVFLENVAFALSLQKGRAIQHVVDALESRGYSWAYRVLDTREFGLPQRRRRVFVCATLEGDPWSIIFDGSPGTPETAPDPAHIGFYWTEGNRGLGWTPGAVPPLKGGSSFSIPSPPAIWHRDTGGFSVPSIEDAERLQGFPTGWTQAASKELGADRGRWRLVGNAVSVNVAAWLGSRLLTRGRTEVIEGLPWQDARGAHNAARGGPGRQPEYLKRCYEGPASPCFQNLQEFGLANHRALSLRAAAGFLRRYEVSKLSKNAAFLSDLNTYCAVSTEDTAVVPYSAPKPG